MLATFVIKFIAKNFQNLPNLVTLLLLMTMMISDDN